MQHFDTSEDKIYKHKKDSKLNFSTKFSNKKKIIVISLIIIAVIIVTLVTISILKSRTFEPLIKMVSGTEYISNEEGQIIVRLEDFRGNPIDDASCSVSLLYPDKSFVFIDRNMSATTVPGNYYYSFTTPQTEGVYEEHITCDVIRNGNLKELHISSSFHVSAGLNLIVQVSRSQRENYEDLVNRINALDTNLTSRINTVDSKVTNLQTFVDNNVVGELSNINQSIEDINVNMDIAMNGIEQSLNQTMLDNFNDLADKFKGVGDAMSNLFDTN